MIKKLKNHSQDIAIQMKKVFMASYAIEAKLLQAEDFPPLKRTLEQYIETDTEYYEFWQENILTAVIEIRILESSIHIQSLVVHPDYFRQGIAGKLIDHVLNHHQTPLFTVETGKANHPAIKLYEKYGFQLVKEYLPDHGIYKVCMERQSSISILGCGWLGFPLAQQLIEKGYSINGSTTSQKKITDFEQAQISAYILNLEGLNRLEKDFLDSKILIIAVPSKDIHGFKQLIDLIENSMIKKVLFISSTSVYPSNNSVVDEETKTLDTPLAQIEDLFRNNENFEVSILRFAGLFGYDRKPGNFVRKAKKVKNPEGFVNMIHQDDCIAIIEKIIQQQAWNQTFNACADEHPTRREYYTQESLKLGYPIPQFDEESNNVYKIVSNKKLKDRLNYKYIYPKLMKKSKYQTTIKTYNKLAQAYQDRFMELDIYNHTYDRFCELVDVENPTVLEIACGPGNVSRYLLNKRPDVKILGIDLAEKMIELAKVNNPTVEYQVMDCLDISQLEHKFDAVMSGFCMPYISKQDCIKQIQDVSGLINPGGLFYLSTMEDDPAKSGLKGSANHDEKVYMFFHQADYLIQALEQNGFEIVDIKRQDYSDSEETKTTDLFIYARKLETAAS